MTIQITFTKNFDILIQYLLFADEDLKAVERIHCVIEIEQNERKNEQRDLWIFYTDLSICFNNLIVFPSQVP